MDLLAQVWAERIKRLDAQGERRDQETDHELWYFTGAETSLRIFRHDTLGDDRRLWAASLDNFVVHDAKKKREQKEAISTAKTYASNRAELREGRNLILFGSPGTGKDHLAMGVAKEIFYETGIASFRTTGLRVSALMRESIEKKGTGRLIEEYSNYDLLWISDPCLSGRSLTEWEMGWFYQIIDTRYRNLRPTIITVNAETGKDIATMLGTASFDRLKDKCSFIFTDWASYRSPDRKLNLCTLKMPYDGMTDRQVLALSGRPEYVEGKYLYCDFDKCRVPKGMSRKEWEAQTAEKERLATEAEEQRKADIQARKVRDEAEWEREKSLRMAEIQKWVAEIQEQEIEEDV